MDGRAICPTLPRRPTSALRNPRRRVCNLHVILRHRGKPHRFTVVSELATIRPESHPFRTSRDVFLSEKVSRLISTHARGAYVPTVFVGVYTTLGLSMPSQHFVHGQDRSVIPEIEPASRPQPVVRVLDQASIHGIVVQVIQFLINSPKVATACFLKRSGSSRRAR